MWDQPHRNTWVTRLNLTIRAAGRPVVLVAHSLGCVAVAWWARLVGPEAGELVAGALLVAPPEIDADAGDARLRGFAPVPSGPLPFPAILVASHDDPYMDIGAARRLARGWGARFADAGAIGHINAESDIGDWAFGRFLLDQVLKGAARPSSVLASARGGEVSHLGRGQDSSPDRTALWSPPASG